MSSPWDMPLSKSNANSHAMYHGLSGWCMRNVYDLWPSLENIITQWSTKILPLEVVFTRSESSIHIDAISLADWSLVEKRLGVYLPTSIQKKWHLDHGGLSASMIRVCRSNSLVNQYSEPKA
jgi:hypothetical protein